jgi:hypothetical protein
LDEITATIAVGKEFPDEARSVASSAVALSRGDKVDPRGRDRNGTETD